MENHEKTVKIISAAAESQTRYFPNTSQAHYCYANLLGPEAFNLHLSFYLILKSHFQCCIRAEGVIVIREVITCNCVSKMLRFP